jgi:hypothetical protein
MDCTMPLPLMTRAEVFVGRFRATMLRCTVMGLMGLLRGRFGGASCVASAAFSLSS